MPKISLADDDTAVIVEHALLFHVASGTLPGPQAETVVRVLGLHGAHVRVVTMEWTSDAPGPVFERLCEAVRSQRGFVGPWRNGRFSMLFPVENDETPWFVAHRDLPPGLRWRGGIGTTVPVLRAGQSWQESVWAVEEGAADVWSDWKPRGTAGAAASFPFGLEKAVLRALSAGDPDQAAFLTSPIWSALESLPTDSLPEAVRQLVVVAAHQRGMEGELTEPLDQILAPFDSPEAGRVPAALKETLRQTLVRLARKRPASNELSPVVQKAMEYVRTNFSKAVSLEEAARVAGVHPQYLSRMFSQEKGESFVDFLTRLRVSKAKELLRGGNNVKATAADVGYADANYFSRLFKKWEGLSPGDYALGKRGGV